MKDPRDIIIAPIVSEKSYGLIEQGVYTFKVHTSASKPEIHDAVEAIWGVQVVKVNTLNRKGKKTRARRANKLQLSLPIRIRGLSSRAPGTAVKAHRVRLTPTLQARSSASAWSSRAAPARWICVRSTTPSASTLPSATWRSSTTTVARRR